MNEWKHSNGLFSWLLVTATNSISCYRTRTEYRIHHILTVSTILLLWSNNWLVMLHWCCISSSVKFLEDPTLCYPSHSNIIKINVRLGLERIKRATSSSCSSTPRLSSLLPATPIIPAPSSSFSWAQPQDFHSLLFCLPFLHCNSDLSLPNFFFPVSCILLLLDFFHHFGLKMVKHIWTLVFYIIWCVYCLLSWTLDRWDDIFGWRFHLFVPYQLCIFMGLLLLSVIQSNSVHKVSIFVYKSHSRAAMNQSPSLQHPSVHIVTHVSSLP